MNKEKINMNQENKEKLLARHKAYYAENKEKLLARHKAYYVDHIIPLRGEKI